MNKHKFINYLRSPESLTEGQLEDLNKSLVDFPYFSIGRSMAAKASKELHHTSKGVLIEIAAIYATDRKHLKKYVNGELFLFANRSDVPLHQDKEDSIPSAVKTERKRPPVVKFTSSNELDLENLKAPTGDEVDQMLDELQQDMSELKKSRDHFVDIQNQIEEEEAISLALRRAAGKAQKKAVKEIKGDTPVKKSDTGTSKTSSSKSKRNPSESKGSARAIKSASKSVETTKKGEKDDDEPGGIRQLIDTFIKENPSIRQGSGMDETTDLAGESSSWTTDLASEYLAQISLDQGNSRRAILIYEALSVKFPKKKSYFADLIQQLKK